MPLWMRIGVVLENLFNVTLIGRNKDTGWKVDWRK